MALLQIEYTLFFRKEKTPSNVVSYFSGYISELFSQSGGNIHSGFCGTDRDNEPTAELDRFIRILEGKGLRVRLSLQLNLGKNCIFTYFGFKRKSV